jgi:hypothetical protein
MRTKIFFFAAALLFVFTASNAQTMAAQKTTMKSGSTSPSAFFNGAWNSSEGNAKGFTVMHDGYFNSVTQDSVGKWDAVHAGTYTVNGDNTITFKILYSSYPDHVGASNTADYTISGETVKVHHFKKLLDANGNDITSQVPKDDYETMTRIK